MSSGGGNTGDGRVCLEEIPDKPEHGITQPARRESAARMVIMLVFVFAIVGMVGGIVATILQVDEDSDGVWAPGENAPQEQAEEIHNWLNFGVSLLPIGIILVMVVITIVVHGVV